MITKLEIGWFRELPEEINDYEPFLNLTKPIPVVKVKETIDKNSFSMNSFNLG